MSIDDQLLSALTLYGLPVLFVAVLVAASGMPLPATLLLITAGSFVHQGSLSLWHVLATALIAAVFGDQIGYGMGRWGGRRLLARVGYWAGGNARLAQAEDTMERWGGPTIFLSRWLLTPLGPLVNLTSGTTRYPWPCFLAFGAAGEAVWVAGYVLLGRTFSDRVQGMSALFGNLVLALIGLVVALGLGWKLLRLNRSRRVQKRE